jgi:hypothetical protein
MNEIMSGIMPWASGVFLLVFLFQFYRSARILHVDGKFSSKENQVFGNASILPMFIVIAVLFVIVLILERLPDAGPWGLLAIGVVVLIGTGWSAKRGVKAVLAFREKERETSQRRARIAASREGSDIEWPLR